MFSVLKKSHLPSRFIETYVSGEGRTGDDDEGYSYNILRGNKKVESQELPLFPLDLIHEATGNFSNENKLGEGGFGPVYKGVLNDGKEIAVKRLSRSSRQGLQEFKDEVTLIAKLQHKNLTWKLWWEGNVQELMDPVLKESFILEELLKRIHIGLLCVQEDPADRPTMSSVVVMLATDTITLPQPTQPAFSVGRVKSSSDLKVCSTNEVTLSTLSPR
ncbi:hypothetical protein WN944_015727 [Citrus x changshan-huyou]|uniref:Protein kinase domain-containing protein n=1 Tax=Citrus x changshan-huyou TaxID=2935761 RepID=A0AAP0M842_9ROSI